MRYFALRKSFGVTSQTSWPFGGETRFSSTKATPAFFMEVMWRCAPAVAASSASTCGLAQEGGGFRAGKQALGVAYFLLRIIEGAGENGGRLRGAHVRAADHQVRVHAERRDTLGHLLGSLDAFLGQIALGLRRALGVFAVDGDAVTDDVELHERGFLLRGNRLPVCLHANYTRAGPACRKNVRT